MSHQRERNRLVRALRKAGFVVVSTASNHWKAYHPNRPGDFVIMAKTPKKSGTHDTMKRLRQIGYEP